MTEIACGSTSQSLMGPPFNKTPFFQSTGMSSSLIKEVYHRGSEATALSYFLNKDFHQVT